MTTLILFFLSVLFLIFCLVSFLKVRNSKEKFGFIYLWAFPLGAFCWEDLLVFSFFHFWVTICTLIVRDIRIGILFVNIFWIVRSAGEILYYFFQQFNQPASYPHDQIQRAALLKKLFGSISHQKRFVIMQVVLQVLLVISVSALILLLRNWLNINKGF